MELQISCFAFFKETSKKKKNFELKIFKFFIIYNFCWQKPAFQALAP